MNVLDHADCPPPTRHTDHTDPEYACDERSTVDDELGIGDLSDVGKFASWEIHRWRVSDVLRRRIQYAALVKKFSLRARLTLKM